MNIHRAVYQLLGLGVLALLGFAGWSFFELNTPDKGIITLDGALRIAAPTVMSLVLAGVRWLHSFHPPATAPLFRSSVTATPPSDTLKASTLSALRSVNADLAKAGRYDELAVMAEAERKIGGMFK